MYLAADSLFRIIGFDSQLLFDSIITGINVFILFFALSYFLFNPIQNALKNRSEKIKSELENAKTKEEIYSLRIEFPKELEPVLKLAGKAHGTMKDYIMELIYNDLEKNIKEYKDQQPVDPDKWKKFL